MKPSNFVIKPVWWTTCYDNLSALDWPAGFGVMSSGVRIGVRTNDIDLVERLQVNLPPGARHIYGDQEFDSVLSVINGGMSANKRVRKFNLLYHNHSLLTRSRNLEPVLDAFDMHLALTEGAYAPRRVFIHAGVVGFGGQAIVLPGRSHAGKSTLVAALVKAGATYYSDEFAVIEPNGAIRPYACPISLRLSSGEKVKLSVEDIGGVVGATPIPVGMLVFTSYKSQAKWRPERLSASQAFLNLMSNSLSGLISPRRTFVRLEKLASCPKRIQTLRSEADIAAERILRLLDDDDSAWRSISALQLQKVGWLPEGTRQSNNSPPKCDKTPGVTHQLTSITSTSAKE